MKQTVKIKNIKTGKISEKEASKSLDNKIHVTMGFGSKAIFFENFVGAKNTITARLGSNKYELVTTL